MVYIETTQEYCRIKKENVDRFDLSTIKRITLHTTRNNIKEGFS